MKLTIIIEDDNGEAPRVFDKAPPTDGGTTAAPKPGDVLAWFQVLEMLVTLLGRLKPRA